jgi:hypothetical protein
MKPDGSPLAQSYFLRCWYEPGEACEPLWRFSLEDVRTGRRRGFPNLEALIIALQLALSDPGGGE